jgi:hypothetical protein
MNEILKQVLAQNTFKDGDFFQVLGKTYLFITFMILECQDTGEMFMRGIDF